MPFILTPFGAVRLDDAKAPTLSVFDVHLFVNNITPIFSTLIGAYTESVVAGYAPQAWDFPTSAVDNLDGTATLVGTVLIWTPTNTLLTEQIYGIFVTDPANSDALVGGGRFVDAPITWGNTLVPFVYQPRWREESIP